MTGDDPPTAPCTERMKPFNRAHENAREIRQWMQEIEEDLHTMEWGAAGGLGAASRESVIDSIDAQIGNLQSLREQIEELPDPREVGSAARDDDDENPGDSA